MRFLHISDLHFGKSMNEVSLVESDQPYWKNSFIKAVKETGAEAVVIAGDVYDRSNPSNEAVKLFDEMITELSQMKIPVLMVAGNHDSGQKLGFAGSVLEKGGVYVAGVPTAEIKHVTLNDNFGDVTFWLVPYIFPQEVNYLLGCDDIRDYDEAFRRLLSVQEIDFSKRNVIVAHQNVTHNGIEAERGGSESMVAGVGGIDCTAFDGFEYAALGHIHRAQSVGRNAVRYAGSPLCYHFDEAKFANKGAVLVEISEKGSEPKISQVIIPPLHNVRVIRGTFSEVLEKEQNAASSSEYLRAEITDKHPTPEMCAALRSAAALHNSVFLEIVPALNKPVFGEKSHSHSAQTERSIDELFSDLFEQTYDCPPDEKEAELIKALTEFMEQMSVGTDELKNAAESDIRDISERLGDKLVAAAIKQEESL